MGSRERKRAARQKRKTRSSERRASAEALAEETVSAASAANGDRPEDDVAARAESAAERKNRETREALEPLREGERPTVVTVSAVICTVLVALSALGYALWGVLRADEPRPEAFGVIAFIVMIGAMAYGLWRARYWAVLGWQSTLVLVIIASALNLLAALSLFLALGSLILMIGAGILFYFMIKAWARIQMPTRAPRD